MRRIPLWLPLAFVGCLVMLWGVLLLALPGNAQAQSDEREYMGTRECRSCHRSTAEQLAETGHALTLFDAAEEAEHILADFSAADIPQVQFPGEAAPRPIMLDDVAFAVGAGRYVQRYLYETGANEYLVLPAEWNTRENRWQPFALADEWPTAAYDWADNCAYCHTTNFDTETGAWDDEGVQCEACHGPGSEHVDVVDDAGRSIDAEEMRLVEASIELGLDTQVCGQCHSAGQQAGTELPYPTNYVPGSTLLHESGFTLSNPGDPAHWWTTEHAAQPNMQFNEWVDSGHASAFDMLLTADNFEIGCLSCHNTTYAQVARTLTAKTVEDDRDSREFLEDLYDEAGIEIDDIDDLDFETLRQETIAAFDIDPATISAEKPFFEQVLPHIIARIIEAGEPQESEFIPQSIIAVIQQASTSEAGNSLELGVTCASCHSPHGEQVESSLLRTAPYELCISCHQSAEPYAGLHHPVQEMFEGQPFVNEVAPVAGTHFTAEDSPDCVTCHMAQVPVESATRFSHSLAPLLPEAIAEGMAFDDTCSGCHGEAVTADSLQQLIADIQTSTRSRIETAQTARTDATPQWVGQVLEIIEQDGSFGIHNYAYTSTLLTAVEREMGLVDDTVAISLPEAPPEGFTLPRVRVIRSRGLSLPSIVLLIISIGILAYSAYAFFIRKGNS